MFWVDLLFVFLVAVVLSIILSWGLGWRHPAAADAFAVSMVFLFVILLFTVWAAVAWLPPWGPAWRGTPWLSILLIGIIVSLLILAAATPIRRRPRTPTQAAAEAREESLTATVFGVFFWALLAGLLVAIAISYFV